MLDDRLPVEAATTATGARTIATQIADTMAVTWRPLSRCDFVSCSTGSPVRCRSDRRGQCVSAGATTSHGGLLELGIKRLDREARCRTPARKLVQSTAETHFPSASPRRHREPRLPGAYAWLQLKVLPVCGIGPIVGAADDPWTASMRAPSPARTATAAAATTKMRAVTQSF